MARYEQPREDILREATALVERIEIEVPGATELSVVGFRRDGSPSFFFGPDFVVQFNSRGELRRAFLNGRLLKADHGKLYVMDRVRSESEVILSSTALSESETAEFLKQVDQRFHALQSAIIANQLRILRQIPPDREIVPRVLAWLDRHLSGIQIAQQPHAR